MAVISTNFSINGSDGQGAFSPGLFVKAGFLARVSNVFALACNRACQVFTRDPVPAPVDPSLWVAPVTRTNAVDDGENRLTDIDRGLVIARCTQDEKGDLDVACAKLRRIEEELGSLIKRDKLASNKCMKVRVGGFTREEFLESNANFKKLSSKLRSKRFVCKQALSQAKLEHAAALEKYNTAVAQTEMLIPKGKNFVAWQRAKN